MGKLLLTYAYFLMCYILFQPLSEDDFTAIFAHRSVIYQEEVRVIVVEDRVVGLGR